MLRVVGALADHGSITAAAAALGYSQPAVSQQLKRLERRIGLAVIERVGRGVRLTDAGRLLARHADTVSGALDTAAEELAELRGLRAGRVRIAAFPSASATIVPRLLADLRRRHPGVSVTYVEAEPPEAVALVRQNQADLAITFSYPGDRVDPHRDSAEGLVVTRLRRDEMMVVLPVGHARAGDAAVDLGNLAEENWIGGCPRCRGHLLELCGHSGFTPKVSYETDNAAAVIGLVAAGIGVAMLPALALDSVGAQPLVAIRPTRGRDQRTLHAVTATGAAGVPAIAATLRRLAVLDSPPASTRQAN
ncbi:LysR family transcriptional regulator [Cryobacterium breve]|uniref:LysR family transcriptional regulator n=2 Tax=Cryobacterium TaxID=69578 RepID=A0ABY2J992_9MICO|nr:MULTISPECIES: LysR family transcriptional regulator [Cryobacterium]TFC95269.1 LysR family transcriptional regulator [Cryobacterium sp. TmT3-12]TFD00452.1 LysR family transcriptional regulator [Cryobacterium breve]